MVAALWLRELRLGRDRRRAELGVLVMMAALRGEGEVRRV